MSIIFLIKSFVIRKRYLQKKLPYAVAFNLLKDWTAKFGDLILQAPHWYRSSAVTRFRRNVFASSFNNRMSATNFTMVKSPSGSNSLSSSSGRSSGGGSSGGGAGRGGGSW